MKLTPRQRDLLSYVVLNPKTRLIRAPDPLGRAAVWSVGDLYFTAVTAQKLIALGLFDRVDQDLPAGFEHYLINEKGLEAYQQVKYEEENDDPLKVKIAETAKGRSRKSKKPPKHGPKTKRWHRKYDRVIIAKKREGMSVSQIAREFRISESTVRNILRPHGLLKERKKRISNPWYR